MQVLAATVKRSARRSRGESVVPLLPESLSSTYVLRLAGGAPCAFGSLWMAAVGVRLFGWRALQPKVLLGTEWRSAVEGMAEGMGGGVLRDSGVVDGDLYGALETVSWMW